MAWASVGLGYAVGLEDRLLWTVPGGWDQVAWHDIQHGGWSPEEKELHWTTVEGVEHALGLTDPGTLPSLFRERVEATILVQLAFMPPDASREVTISGRRALGTDATITWGWSQASGGKLTPTALGAVEDEVQRIATEYDPE